MLKGISSERKIALFFPIKNNFVNAQNMTESNFWEKNILVNFGQKNLPKIGFLRLFLGFLDKIVSLVFFLIFGRKIE